MMFPLIFLSSAALLFQMTDDSATPLTTRPACTRKLVGLMWPPEANSQPAVLHKLSREGKLTICSRGTWRHQWTSPSVHVSQLKKKKPQTAVAARDAKSPGTAASVAEEP
jgi:hypothetical protein